MLEALPGIYVITCKVTGKQYVGSSKNVRDRWSSHKSALRRSQNHSTIMQHAWDKYGEEAFSCEALEYVDSHDDLIPREQYYIDTLHPALNVRTIADRNVHVAHVISPETRAKISAAQKGIAPIKAIEASIKARRGKKKGPLPPETRAKIGAANKKHPYKKRGPHSPETRAKISAGRKGKYPSPETRAKLIAARRRRALYSPETRAKMSATQTQRRAKEKEQALRTLREPIIPSTDTEWKQGLTAPSLWDAEASEE